MAAYTYNDFIPASPLADHLQRAGLMVGNAVLKVVSIMETAHLRAQTRRQLEALSDRQLEDIGLCRGDIEDVVGKI